jgi:hypothetical protein
VLDKLKPMVDKLKEKDGITFLICGHDVVKAMGLPQSKDKDNMSDYVGDWNELRIYHDPYLAGDEVISGKKAAPLPEAAEGIFYVNGVLNNG